MVFRYSDIQDQPIPAHWILWDLLICSRVPIVGSLSSSCPMSYWRPAVLLLLLYRYRQGRLRRQSRWSLLSQGLSRWRGTINLVIFRESHRACAHSIVSFESTEGTNSLFMNKPKGTEMDLLDFGIVILAVREDDIMFRDKRRIWYKVFWTNMRQ